MTQFRAIVVAILLLLAIIAVIAGIKWQQIDYMMESSEGFSQPPETVSIVEVEEQVWPENLSAVGALAAWQGLVLSAEVNGRVSAIYFESGQQVKAGDVLLEQESGNEKAQLRAAIARRDLAKSNLRRLESLRDKQSVSQSALDEAAQQVESAEGDVDNLQTTLSKKRIVAPFSGRLGIRQVYIGQDLQVGTPLVSLQSIDQLRVNFTLPQHWYGRIEPGFKVNVFSKQKVNVSGEVLATAAEIDPTTRNLHVQARIDNQQNLLLPGMSIALTVELPNPTTVIAIPTTAVLYAPYGDTVFIVKAAENGGADTVTQQFVRLGEARGDFVAVEAGLDVGQRVVSDGAFKLFNGMPVVESDKPLPERSLNPSPSDS